MKPLAWIGLMALLLALAGCSGGDPKTRLSETVAAMQQAIEDKAADEVMDLVAEDFRGHNGLDRDGLRRLLVLHFLRNQSIGVTLGPMDLRVQVPRAEISVNVFLTGAEGWIPERAAGYKVVSKWRQDGDDWLLEYIEW
ncbi:nuclear transport factor 2 family protein [Pseudomarimonas arenosa]|uniref:Nuclear transport factor 2 family protein n=1 Tax=Pseudomarimonas arenosa TaxID=2774145 RepID=A0AAW3ZKY5_9GAMM|nr:nuclear transport factor 2 family protein [Pseudomarimonas arenosa]MBD8526696.1 nuclear transport factor 2 family protein [Pseudomarimonas arenosa]